MEPWRTGITTSDEKSIFIRGYDVTSLMQQATFTETIFLLHQGRLPTKEERALLDAILIGVSDHGPSAPSAAAARIVASGNRRSLEAAVAAGVLAMGDAHGGAAFDCMQMICDGVAVARREGLSLQDAARRAVADARTGKRRLPGIGHRVHTEDPRTRVLFEMARARGVARDGVAFMQALEAAACDRDPPDAYQHRRRIVGSIARPGIPSAGGQTYFYHRARGRRDGASDGRTHAREGRCASFR